jgi:regulator of protease activity HflC (stomatin/prohibitin superfamily)
MYETSNGIMNLLGLGGMSVWLVLFIIAALVIIVTGLFTVEQQTIAVIERFGKFVRVAHPGLNLKIPLIEAIRGRISLRVMQLDVEIETKTLDDVFLKIVTSVQYRVLPQKIYEAFYVLDNPTSQIQSFVFDVVRASVPKIKLDDVFSRKDDIADSVKSELKETMSQFGLDIIKTLVTDINPDAKVKTAMNEINEAQRLRVAANERGEAEKILKVKQAEADAESKILQGKGMAGQRKAIVDGLRDSLSDFQRDIQGTTTHDVMTLIMMAQYFDTLKELGANGNANTIMVPHSPSHMNDLSQQIRDSIIAGGQVNMAADNKK